MSVRLEEPIGRDAGLAGQLNVEVTRDGRRVDVKVFSPSGPVPGRGVSKIFVVLLLDDTGRSSRARRELQGGESSGDQ